MKEKERENRYFGRNVSIFLTGAEMAIPRMQAASTINFILKLAVTEREF